MQYALETPESLLDQYGEHMQIHELSRRRQTNEGFMDAMRAIKSGAAQSINQNLGTNIGGATAGATVAPGYAQQAATGATAPLINKIAQEKSEQWDQTLAAAMKNENTPYMSQLDGNNLTTIATKMVNNDLRTLGNDYKTLAANIDPASMGGKGQQMARDIVTRIDNEITELINTAKNPSYNPKTLKDLNQKSWQKLAGLIHTAMSMGQFQRGASNPAAATASNPAASPQLNAAMQAMGVDAAGLMKLNAAVRQSGQKLNITSTGSSLVDSLLKAAKLL